MEKQISIFDKISNYVLYFCSSFIISVGLLSLHDNVFDNDWNKFSWGMIGMIFVVGAFTLSIHFSKNNKEFTRIGSMAILSGILMFFSNGLQQIISKNQMIIKIFIYPAVIIEFLAIFLFAFSLTFLFVELVKNIFRKE
jgi:hypothetical protein